MKIIEASQKYRIEMEKALKKDRFDHTLGVAYTAANMAFVFDEDIEKAIKNTEFSKLVDLLNTQHKSLTIENQHNGKTR